jgi:ABC-type transport system involved in cytochrome bd biosynthesis fused ATPase/permease subunit
MRFDFTPTPNDYKKIIRIYHLSDKRLWIVIGLFGIPQLCCSISIIIQNGFSAGIYPFLLALLFPAFILYLLVLVPLNFAQRAKKDERLTSKTTWIVSDDQIIVKNDYADSKTSWDAFQKVIEARAYYLFFYQGKKNQFQMLPKRAFNTVDQELAFQKMVSKKVENYRVLQNF